MQTYVQRKMEQKRNLQYIHQFMYIFIYIYIQTSAVSSCWTSLFYFFPLTCKHAALIQSIWGWLTLHDCFTHPYVRRQENMDKRHGWLLGKALCSLLSGFVTFFQCSCGTVRKGETVWRSMREDEPHFSWCYCLIETVCSNVPNHVGHLGCTCKLSKLAAAQK